MLPSILFKDDSDEYLVLPMHQDLTPLKSLCEKIFELLSHSDQSAQKPVGHGESTDTKSSTQPEEKSEANPKWPKWKFPTLPHHIQVVISCIYSLVP